MTRKLLLVVVVALASALGSAAGHQDRCCSCIGEGTACTACFYGTEAGACGGYQAGSLRYCGCAADVGDIACPRVDSQTTVMSSADRDPRREPKAYQLGGGLLNPGQRRDGAYDFEEWALLSAEGTVLRASHLEFAKRVTVQAQRFWPREKSSAAALLVIEAPVHSSNSREILPPLVGPIELDEDLPASLDGEEIWFRAEAGQDGTVDQVVLLNASEAVKAGKLDPDLTVLNHQLRDAVKLLYADEGRHRAVVFGLLRANTEGHLVLVRSQVLLPKGCQMGAAK